MTLSQVVEDRINIHLTCKACGMKQPAYPLAMVGRNGPDVELDVALHLTPCSFCEKVGQFTAMVIATH